MMTEVIWQERPELRAPVMVCAFKGWNDAGEAATAALSYIKGSFDARDVARIDPEVKAFVERLESAVDESQAENPPDEGQLPSADTIASDFQRFLRQRGPEGPGQGS